MLKLLIIVFMSMLIQGDLPYWADKSGRTPTATCNQYRLYRINTDPTISTSFTYKDCYGITRTAYLDPSTNTYQTYICSSTTPTLSQFPPAPLFPPQAHFELLEGGCGKPDPEDPEAPDIPGAPVVDCGMALSSSGGSFYPAIYVLDLKSQVGSVTVFHDALSDGPEVFEVRSSDGETVLYNTGFRGGNAYQILLYDFCKFIGDSDCQHGGKYKLSGSSFGTFTFDINERYLLFYVWSPLHLMDANQFGRNWTATVGCPVTIP